MAAISFGAQRPSEGSIESDRETSQSNSTLVSFSRGSWRMATIAGNASAASALEASSPVARAASACLARPAVAATRIADGSFASRAAEASGPAVGGHGFPSFALSSPTKSNALMRTSRSASSSLASFPKKSRNTWLASSNAFSSAISVSRSSRMRRRVRSMVERLLARASCGRAVSSSKARSVASRPPPSRRFSL